MNWALHEKFDNHKAHHSRHNISLLEHMQDAMKDDLLIIASNMLQKSATSIY